MTSDNDPDQTLPGNPHARAAAFVDDARFPAAAIREALLAVAFEIRRGKQPEPDYADEAAWYEAGTWENGIPRDRLYQDLPPETEGPEPWPYRGP